MFKTLKKKLFKKTNIIEVTQDMLVDRFGFSLSHKDFHAHCIFLKEYSSFFNLEKSFTLEFYKSLMEIRLNGKWHLNKINMNTPYFLMPWGGNIKRFSNYSIEDSIFFMEKILNLKKKIEKEGYNPKKYNTYPDVCILRKINLKEKAIIINGNHRLSILLNNGESKFKVNCIEIINECEVEKWLRVKDGTFTKDQALEWFDYYFNTDNGFQFLKENIDDPAFWEKAKPFLKD